LASGLNEVVFGFRSLESFYFGTVGV